MLWKGSQVPPEEDEEEAVTKKAIKELFVVCFFFNYFTLSLFFYILFTHDIYPHPRPTTSTHDPRPTTHDPRHLATLQNGEHKKYLWNVIALREISQ